MTATSEKLEYLALCKYKPNSSIRIDIQKQCGHKVIGGYYVHSSKMRELGDKFSVIDVWVEQFRGHFLVFGTYGACEVDGRLLEIRRTRENAAKSAYHEALRFAKKLAVKTRLELVDETPKAQQSQLETKAYR